MSWDADAKSSVDQPLREDFAFAERCERRDWKGCYVVDDTLLLRMWRMGGMERVRKGKQYPLTLLRLDEGNAGEIWGVEELGLLGR